MTILKKLILLNFIWLSLFFASGAFEKVFAISYNWWSTRSYPLNYDWRFFLDSYPYNYDRDCFIGNWTDWTNASTPAPISCYNEWFFSKAMIWWITEFDFSSLVLSWYLLNSNTIYANNTSVGITRPIWSRLYIEKFSSGYNLRVNVKTLEQIDAFDWILATIYSSSTGSSTFWPNRYSVAFFSEYWRKKNSLNSEIWFYLREINFCIYLSKDLWNYCYRKNFITSSLPDWLNLSYWLHYSDFLPFQDNINWYSYAWNSIAGSYGVSYTPAQFLSDDSGNKQKFIDFITLTWSNSLTNWYWGNSSIVIFQNWDQTQWTWWTSGTWWSIDYFASCTNFLDVGCYIKWTYNSFIGWVDSLFPWISFHGAVDTCALGSTSTWGTFVARMANFVSLVNPFLPENWTTICTLFLWITASWNTFQAWSQTIEYQKLWPSENFFKVYLHWQVDPRLEMDMRNILYWQSPIDLIIIIVIISTVIYHRKHQND